MKMISVFFFKPISFHAEHLPEQEEKGEEEEWKHMGTTANVLTLNSQEQVPLSEFRAS